MVRGGQEREIARRRFRALAAKVKQAYRVALFCGAIPLIVGVSIFLLWLVTRWDWLMLAGVFTIYGGIGLFLIGSVALANYFRLGWRTPELLRRSLWRSTLGCAGLLLSNFVVAAAIIVAGFALDGWLDETKSQQIMNVTEPQRIAFHALDNRHLSGATLHVHGHIDGIASIKGPLNEGEPKTISGDVDWAIYGDYFHPDIAFEYVPVNVTSGQLTFELTFH